MSKRNRKSAGTTLIEILVVIVVFTVGILAVVQIFPKGFQILTLNRMAAMATFLSRDQMQKLNAHPEMLPEAILPVDIHGDTADPNFVSTNLSFNGLGINPDGSAILGDGNSVDFANNPVNWQSVTGFNNVRRIVGETQTIPAPKIVGNGGINTYGGLVVLQFGPTSVYFKSNGSADNLQVYSNDLTKNLGYPTAGVVYSDFDYFFIASLPNANPVSFQVQVPVGSLTRQYRVSFDAYVVQSSGTPLKRSYSQTVTVTSTASATNGFHPIYLAGSPDNANPNIVSDTLASIDFDSIRVQRVFIPISSASAFDHDPFEVKLLNPYLGTLLFSPYAYNYYITRSAGPREALKAKITYDVRDWRILREDFRVDGNAPSSHQLPIQSLRTATQAYVDGRPATGGTNGFGFENALTDQNGVDHFVLMDLSTGGTFYEADPVSHQSLISVDKSRGIISFNDYDASRAGVQGYLLLPDGSSQEVDMADRPVRALYQARWEVAVQPLKAASLYSVSNGPPSTGQYYIGGSSTAFGGIPYRAYFPPCDTGRKVTVGQIWYKDSSNVTRQAQAQDFLIHPASSGQGDTTNLPYIDIKENIGDAASLDQTTYGYALRDVKGSSLVVRVLWNPNTFTLPGGAASNAQAEAAWAQTWRHSATESYLDQGVTSR